MAESRATSAVSRRGPRVVRVGAPRSAGRAFALGPAIVLVLAAAILPFAAGDARARSARREEAAGPTDPTAAALIHTLGGFRSVVITSLWVQAMNYYDEGEWYEVLPICEMLSRLQPEVPQVWTWHSELMAYDIASKVENPDDRYEWVARAILRMREGMRWNPRSDDLPIRLGDLIAIRMVFERTRDPDLEPRLRRDSRVDPEGLPAARLAFDAYRDALAVDGHFVGADFGCLRMAPALAPRRDPDLAAFLAALSRHIREAHPEAGGDSLERLLQNLRQAGVDIDRPPPAGPPRSFPE